MTLLFNWVLNNTVNFFFTQKVQYEKARKQKSKNCLLKNGRSLSGRDKGFLVGLTPNFFFYFYSLVTLFSSSGLWLKYLCQIDAAIDKKQRLYGVNNLLQLECHTAQVWFEIMIRLKLYNTTFNDMYHFIISIVRLKNSVAQMQDFLVCTNVLLIQ